MELNSEVKFGDETLKKAYHELAEGKFEDKRLKEWLDRAAADLKENAFSGTKNENNISFLYRNEVVSSFLAFKSPNGLFQKSTKINLVRLLICGNITCLMPGD